MTSPCCRSMSLAIPASVVSLARLYHPISPIRAPAAGQDASSSAESISRGPASVEVLLGFAIALAISLTGVGAGSLTTPLLILLFGVSPAVGVGTALTFGAIVKIASLPVYVVRRQINWRILQLLFFGGIPGMIVCCSLLNRIKRGPYERYLYIALGVLIIATALFNLFRIFRPKPQPSITTVPGCSPG